MNARGIVLAVSICLALAGCGSGPGSTSYADPFTLPVGPMRWDSPTAPAWILDGTLHVGDQSVEIGDKVDTFVVGLTGAYWMRDDTLWFTSAAGGSERVADVIWDNMAVSADRSVFATVDQSRGPTDRYGAHVMQLAVFDTGTGEQLYRTPDKEPDRGDDLGALYSEVMPLLDGVSNDRAFYGYRTIDLRDGSVAETTPDPEGVDEYPGYADALFPDGYHVGIRGQGRHRELADSPAFGVGLLSPDRSTIFDSGSWPTNAVVYDADTGEQEPIDAPWDHFILTGWEDDDTFHGVAQRIDPRNEVNSLRAQQVVTCELDTLACTPVSPVFRTGRNELGRPFPRFLVDGDGIVNL